MKKIVIISMVCILFTGILYAKPKPAPNPQVEMAVSNLLQALESDNIGLKNSAMFQLTKLKFQYPDYNMAKVEKVIAKLEKNDNSSIIRINANLVKTIMKENPKESTVFITAPDHREFFNNLYSTLVLSSEQ